MNIGFDLDKVFIDTPPFIPDGIIERLYKKKSNGTLVYRTPSKTEQLIRIISHLPIFRPPLKNNLTFLNSIPKDRHTLYLVSSRFSFLKQPTRTIVRTHKLDKIFQELYFNFNNEQPHIFKSRIINKLKLDKFVDDDLHLLKYVASKNNKIKLYWLNKKLNKKIGPNITAITHLSQVLQD